MLELEYTSFINLRQKKTTNNKQQQQQQQPTHVNKSKDFHLTEGRGFDFWKSFGSFEAPEVSIGGFGLSLAAFGNAVHGSTISLLANTMTSCSERRKCCNHFACA
jgi:hypothetical protein